MEGLTWKIHRERMDLCSAGIFLARRNSVFVASARMTFKSACCVNMRCSSAHCWRRACCASNARLSSALSSCSCSCSRRSSSHSSHAAFHSAFRCSRVTHSKSRRFSSRARRRSSLNFLGRAIYSQSSLEELQVVFRVSWLADAYKVTKKCRIITLVLQRVLCNSLLLKFRVAGFEV